MIAHKHLWYLVLALYPHKFCQIFLLFDIKFSSQNTARNMKNTATSVHDDKNQHMIDAFSSKV